MINEEIEIVNEIYGIISEINFFNFDSFEYIYKENEKEGWSSMGIIYKLNDIIVSQNDFEILDEDMLENLTQRLRSVMFNKTGGKWGRFILCFKNNKIETKFDYSEQFLC